jgi:tRNA dimethylallyltransferase
MESTADRTRLIVICGPTGIGKTSLAIDLARRFLGEIIGADAMQIYRYMDIGTAKPTPEEQAAIRHHLVDVVDPDEPFDAARFRDLATQAIRMIRREGRRPFVVGGTGLYIKALIHGLFEAPAADPQVRRRLQSEAAADAEAVYRRLEEEDPESAARIHPNDTYRVIRALEVLESTGVPLSRHLGRHGFLREHYPALKILLNMDRGELYRRIDLRVDQMVQQGLLEEVRSLLQRGYAPDLKSMQAIGYRHMLDYLAGKTGWKESVALLKRDTRRYAKRQLTWFRADPAMQEASPGEGDRLAARIHHFLERDTEKDSA